MAVKFSENQIEAINGRGKSLVLSASAGSGKTTVLVERVLKYVCEDGVSLENLVVVTFTNAAAAGIKDKLRKKLNEKLSENPENEHIRKQLLNLSNAEISTVHSFCGRLIKKYGHLLSENIPSSAKLLNDTEDKLLRQEVLEEVFDDFYESSDEEFINLIECMSPGRNDEALIELMLKMYEYVLSIPFYKEWIDSSLAQFDEKEDFDNTKMGKEAYSYLDKLIGSAISKYELAVEYVSVTEGLAAQEPVYREELSLLKEVYRKPTFSERTEVLSSIPFSRLPSAKRGSDTSVSSGIRDRVKKAVREFNEDFSKIIMPDEENIRALKKFFSVILEFDSRYKEKKYNNGNISFIDQEHLAIEILEKDEVSEELKNKYAEIMVDEFQDTNSVQDYIFSRISKENNLFCVGDVKQSIYRFRHANPSVFTGKIEKGLSDDNTETLYLNENYRSSDEVAGFSNLIFSYIMNKETSFTDYHKTDMLIPRKKVSDKAYIPELILCDSSKDSESGITPSEAGAIAAKIEEMLLDFDFRIGEEKRRLKYSDIVILTRSFNEKTLKFLSELTALGIPCKYEDKVNLFDTPEIKVVLSLLRAVDNPLDDISLIAVLRNVFELSDNEIFKLRSNDKFSDFNTLISKERPDIKKYLDGLRAYSYKYPISSVIEKIYDDFMMPEKWAAMYGSVRKDNLKKLLHLSEEYENEGFKGVSAFIKYINKIIATKAKLPSEDDSSLNDNDYVRVMTIHKSKGLEFPVVFLSGCGGKFNKKDISERVIADVSLGIGCTNSNQKTGIKNSTTFKNIIANKELEELLSEEERLLYVALTRAEYKIIVTGSLSNIEKRLAEYSASAYNSKFGLSYIDFIKSGCYLDMIVPPLLFTRSGNGYGTNIPCELKNAVADIDMKFILCSDNPVKEELSEINFEKLRVQIPQREYKEVRKVWNYSTLFKNIPKKVSVTALNKLQSGKGGVMGTPELYTPVFSQKNKIPDQQRGVMLHYIFEKINLQYLRENKDILEAIHEITEKNPLIRENITVDDIKKVEEFFKSPVGVKLLRSEKVLREQDFLMFMDSSEVYNLPQGKKITVQGIIDCCFWDNMGEVWLVDYKYTKMKEEKIVETYKYQLELYKKALSKIMNVEIERIHACIWDINRCISYKV